MATLEMFESIHSLGDWVRIKRKSRGWTQDELAEASQITKGYVSAIERNAPHSLTGKPTTPSVEILDRIAAALAPSPRMVTQYRNEARDWAGFKLASGNPILPNADSGCHDLDDILNGLDDHQRRIVVNVARAARESLLSLA